MDGYQIMSIYQKSSLPTSIVSLDTQDHSGQGEHNYMISFK